MPHLSRREITRQLLGAAALISLLRVALPGGAFAAPIRRPAEAWAAGLVELAGDLRQRSLSMTQWQEAMAALNARVPIPELLSYLDFDRLQKLLAAQGEGEQFTRLRLPALEGVRAWTALFALPAGAVILPHGHNNQVGAHLVLSGHFHTRTFDRVGDEPGHMLLRPKLNESRGIGETVTMSNDRDNVHWFRAEGGAPVFTFDITLRTPDLRQYENPTERDGRIFVDPTGRPRGDGLIEAPVISHAKSMTRFGAG